MIVTEIVRLEGKLERQIFLERGSQGNWQAGNQRLSMGNGGMQF
jgi:hypothetical protein